MPVHTEVENIVKRIKLL